MRTNSTFPIAFPAFSALTVLLCITANLPVAGCAARKSGQVELFLIRESDGRLRPSLTVAADDLKGSPSSTTRHAVPSFGDPVRLNSDVLTVQVDSVYLHHLPVTFTGSRDVILFADIWENAALPYDQPNLTNIVYLGRNQTIPGRLNFEGNLAYGPTLFKGHPLRIQFTILVLQREIGERSAAVVDVVQTLISSTSDDSSAVIGPDIAGVIKAILSAQPDIVAFDFCAVFLSDSPEDLIDIVTDEQTPLSDQQPDIAPNGESSWYSRKTWLKYGYYALVETARHSGELAVPDSPVDLNLRFSAGRIRQDGREVPANYLVFSIVPSQLAQADEVLKEATAANRKLLETLARSGEEITRAVKEVDAAASSLKRSILEAKAEREARRAARRKENVEQFELAFRNVWTAVTATLPEEQKSVAQEIYDLVLARWQSRFAQTSGASSKDDG